MVDAPKAPLFVAMAAMAGVLASGMLRGVMIGALLSLVLLLTMPAVRASSTDQTPATGTDRKFLTPP